MNKNEKFVITINRELGSGGRSIGEKLAEKLGVKFYDKALIKGLMDHYHLTVDEIEKVKGRKHNWWSDVEHMLQIGPGVTTNYYMLQTNNVSERLTTDEVFKTETMILQDIAAEASCVVAGRSGFYARVVRKQNVNEDEARKIIAKVDEMRENYVKKYTNTSRYDTRNYDLVISMDKMTEDNAVEVIMDFINRQY